MAQHNREFTIELFGNKLIPWMEEQITDTDLDYETIAENLEWAINTFSLSLSFLREWVNGRNVNEYPGPRCPGCGRLTSRPMSSPANQYLQQKLSCYAKGAC